MGDLLVILIVALAGAYIARTYYKKWKNKKACGCVCSGCESLNECGVPPKKEKSKRAHDS